MAWAPDYVTAAELKSYVKIDDTIDDTFIALAITSASRSIDRFAARQFGSTDSVEERTYYQKWDRGLGVYRADIDDIQTITGLVVELDDETVDSDDYDLCPVNAPQKGRPWTEITTETGGSVLKITATWGWSAVPDGIKNACLLQSSRLLNRRNSPFGVAGSPDLGNELRLLSSLDPDVQVIVSDYKRWWGAG